MYLTDDSLYLYTDNQRAYDQSWIITHKPTTIFKLMACSNAMLLLTEVPGKINESSYEIFISNNETRLGAYGTTDFKSAPTSSLIGKMFFLLILNMLLHMKQYKVSKNCFTTFYLR